MLGFKRIKSFGPLLLSAIFIFAYIFFAFYQGAEGGTEFTLTPYRRKILKQRAVLANVLKNAAMPNKTVIITSVNQAYWSSPNSIIDLFLESFRVGEGTQALLGHLVIIAMDEKSFERCKVIHKHCYYFRIKGADFSHEKRFMSPDYLKWMWRRVAFLRLVLELGYNFVFTDTDIMWFRNPFPLFPANADITMATDLYTGNPTDMKNKANTGIIYVVSNTRTLQFYSYWYMSQHLYPRKNEQWAFDIIKRKKDGRKIGARIRYLDPAYFGGFCRRPSFNNVRTMHANCCVGIANKLHDLRLVLQDWRNFTALSVDDQRRQNNYTWRAPSKCRMR